jgi:hypothetical protein
MSRCGVQRCGVAKGGQDNGRERGEAKWSVSHKLGTLGQTTGVLQRSRYLSLYWRGRARRQRVKRKDLLDLWFANGRGNSWWVQVGAGGLLDWAVEVEDVAKGCMRTGPGTMRSSSTPVTERGMELSEHLTEHGVCS